MNDYKRLSSSDMREKHTKRFLQRFHKNHGALNTLKKVFHLTPPFSLFVLRSRKAC